VRRFPWLFRLVRAGERLFVRFGVHPERAIYGSSDFAWTRELEARAPAIRRELQQVLAQREPIPNIQDLSPEQRTLTVDDKWKTFVLFAYGLRAARNCTQCPETAAAVLRIPGMKTAMFSILSADKHIPAHRGPWKGLLRCHLGLIVPGPPDSCRIRIGERVVGWEEGKVLVFDDTFEHEVWNDSGAERVVLFVDFVRPLRAPMAWLNETLLRVIARSRLGRRAMARFADWYAERGIDAQMGERKR
jgi:aspartyl/asparaginyl beta-hydroxylase (cupin superfamily)